MIRWLLTLIYPPKCVFCYRILEKQETDICLNCRKELPYAESLHRSIPYSKKNTAVFFYEGYVRESILRYKFRRKRLYAAPYGRLLAMKLLQEAPEYDVITNVPVSRARRRKRGYDQALELARATARELGRDVQPLLTKIRNNPAQSGISAPEHRRANVLGVYRVIDHSLVRGRKILLIDDVMTTGATLSECCKTLLDAGAAQVSCAVLAASHRNNKQQVR